jgi:basic amino acid/polyamine antiporter, APA family
MATSLAPSRGRLLQVLGIWFGIAAIIGNTIGAGIMRTPSEVARRLPTPGGYLLAWFLGGVYAALGVASMAELGVLMPKSGGQYVYARAVFGRFAGFIVGWSDWVSTCAATAAISMVAAEYASGFGGGNTRIIPVIAVIVVLVFTVVLWRGVREGGNTVQLLTLIKVVALVGLPVVAFSTGVRVPGEASAVTTGALTVGGMVMAMQAVIYTYDGWTGPLYFSGELKDPARDIPRAMFGGVASVFAIYMLLAGCFLVVLGFNGIAVDNFPAGRVATAVFGDAGGTIIRIIVILAGMSAVPPCLMMASRVTYAMTGDGLFPGRAGVVNPGGTPVVTLALSALLTIAFITTGTFNQVIAIAAFFFVLQQVMSFSAVFVLRRREPDRPRPYRAIGYPVTTAISWLGGVAFLIGVVVQDHRNSAIAIGILLVSYPVFRMLPRTSDERA